MSMFSVIIPCYNCSQYVNRAIDSVINQECNDWELILVDNNSKDATLGILNKYRELHPEKVSVFSELNPGAAPARNLGLSHARGEWIVFLDSDDELLPSHLSRIELYISKYQFDVLVGSLCRVIRKGGFEFPFPKFPHRDVWTGLITGHLGITSSNVFRKRCLDNVGGWNANWTSSQEYELMFRILKAGFKVRSARSIPTVNVYYSKNSITRTDDTNKVQSVFNNFVELRLQIRKFLENSDEWNKKYFSAYSSSLYSYYLGKKRILGLSRTFLDVNNIRPGILKKAQMQIRFFFKSLFV